MLAAQIGDRNPGLVLFRNADDLVFGEPAALHLWSFQLGQRLSQTGLGPGGNVSLYLRLISRRCVASDSRTFGIFIVTTISRSIPAVINPSCKQFNGCQQSQWARRVDAIRSWCGRQVNGHANMLTVFNLPRAVGPRVRMRSVPKVTIPPWVPCWFCLTSVGKQRTAHPTGHRPSPRQFGQDHTKCGMHRSKDMQIIDVKSSPGVCNMTACSANCCTTHSVRRK